MCCFYIFKIIPSSNLNLGFKEDTFMVSQQFRNEHRNILLTGGTGFFGKALLRYWMNLLPNERPKMVTVLSREPVRFLSDYPEFQHLEWLRFIKGDVCIAESLPNSANFTDILHAAADSTNGGELKLVDRFDQIVSGTRNMLNYAVNSGTKRFLLTSSGGVYGRQPPEILRFKEDYCGMPDPLNSANTYSVAKRSAEHLCALFAQSHEIDVVIARCFAFVGPDLPLDVHFAIGNFIRDALDRDEITVSGDGTAIRTYLDQHDLALWLDTLILKGRPGQAYNVGSDKEISIADLAKLVRDLLSPNKEVKILGKAQADNFMRSRYVPDIDLAECELGLKVFTHLEQSILSTAQIAQQRRK